MGESMAIVVMRKREIIQKHLKGHELVIISYSKKSDTASGHISLYIYWPISLCMLQFNLLYGQSNSVTLKQCEVILNSQKQNFKKM